MAIVIKNNSGQTQTYAGQEIADGAAYQIQATELPHFQNSSLLIQHAATGVVTINNGIEDLNAANAVKLLLGVDPTPKDSDGSPLYRSKTTEAGWHYEPRSIDFITSQAGSLYNRKHNGWTIDAGVDYGDAVLRFFDQSGNAITQGTSEALVDYQARLNGTCSVTYLDWHPQFELDIIGASVSVKNAPQGNERAYAWVIVAPDIPEGFGGSVPFMAGGWNLRFFAGDTEAQIDGRGVKRFKVDNVNNTNKFRTVIKHEIGAQIACQFIAQLYKA